MKRASLLIAAVVAAGALAATARARADEPPSPTVFAVRADEPPEPPHISPVSPMRADHGLELGVRLGYSLPMGRMGGASGNGGAFISSFETASVPIGVDVGERISPRLYVGGTATWGPGTKTSTGSCGTAGVSCFGQDAQLRGEVRASLAPYGKVGWWVSAGAGWELASFAQSVGSSGVTSTRTGPIFPDLQIGFDIRHEAVAVGFYFGVTVAEFLTQGLDPAATAVSTWVPDRDVHTWVTVGMRGTYGPW
ncbi:MAG TPA: hypothetical protein VIY73_22095 [Polyangiaceae bacterium]